VAERMALRRGRGGPSRAAAGKRPPRRRRRRIDHEPGYRLRLFIVVSAALHAAVFFWPGNADWLMAGAPDADPWIRIELRELPRKTVGAEGGTRARPTPKAKPKAARKATPKAKPEPKPVKRTEGLGATKPKSAVSDRLEAAIARIKQEEHSEGSGAAPAGARVVSPPEKIATYSRLIGDQIRRNWVLHEELAEHAQDSDLEVVLGIVVRKDGAVLRHWVDRGSGMPIFDDSALRAVRRASPLPPFSSGMKDYTLEVLLRFRSEDLL